MISGVLCQMKCKNFNAYNLLLETSNRLLRTSYVKMVKRIIALHPILVYNLFHPQWVKSGQVTSDTRGVQSASR